jgi:hypothetical protein
LRRQPPFCLAASPLGRSASGLGVVACDWDAASLALAAWAVQLFDIVQKFDESLLSAVILACSPDASYFLTSF